MKIGKGGQEIGLYPFPILLLIGIVSAILLPIFNDLSPTAKKVAFGALIVAQIAFIGGVAWYVIGVWTKRGKNSSR